MAGLLLIEDTLIEDALIEDAFRVPFPPCAIDQTSARFRGSRGG